MTVAVALDANQNPLTPWTDNAPRSRCRTAFSVLREGRGHAAATARRHRRRSGGVGQRHESSRSARSDRRVFAHRLGRLASTTAALASVVNDPIYLLVGKRERVISQSRPLPDVTNETDVGKLARPEQPLGDDQRSDGPDHHRAGGFERRFRHSGHQHRGGPHACRAGARNGRKVT